MLHPRSARTSSVRASGKSGFVMTTPQARMGAMAAATRPKRPTWITTTVMPAPASTSIQSGTVFPRGIRNHNPLNIEWDGKTQWRGMTGTDGPYIIFALPEDGIRCGAKVLKAKVYVHDLPSIAEIIPVFAPADDGNDVDAYIQDVSARSGIAPTDSLVPLTTDNLTRLVTAFIWHENGMQPYDDALIQRAVMEALT
jgi:hypothetical protein